MMTIMFFLCTVMLYYISRLIREDPGFWGAALDKRAPFLGLTYSIFLRILSGKEMEQR